MKCQFIHNLISLIGKSASNGKRKQNDSDDEESESEEESEDEDERRKTKKQKTQVAETNESDMSETDSDSSDSDSDDYEDDDIHRVLKHRHATSGLTNGAPKNNSKKDGFEVVPISQPGKVIFIFSHFTSVFCVL